MLVVSCYLGIGHWALGIGDFKLLFVIIFEGLPITNYQLPIPDARCPMPDARCPMPDARCPITMIRYSMPLVVGRGNSNAL
ncbi:hypothetical protein CP500_004145 [Tychonema bourrellyi FEM_GT703]|uniref:Uncharacterized protein n=1 Tax=Tychonema bourrellyi FEM_GT703 TaxID=2040638 RepID=A0A2G4F4K7_9CYAN|nr:hypothetical protein CP500_004145 [Tychonema bourrellyi FEM_GT703]